MLIDTHTHLGHLASPEDLQGLIDRARAAGVTRLVAVGGEPEANAAALVAAAKYPRTVWAAVAFDRHMAGKGIDLADIERLVAAAPRGQVVAIGETGLDAHHPTPPLSDQIDLMARQLDLARRLRLPAIVHTREADEATFTLLAAHARAWPGDPARIGVVHCYTGDAVFAARLVGLGFRIGISGILTFRNANALRDVVISLPADCLLIETDSPYLAPVPHRGKPNEPAWVRLVADRLASLRGEALETIARQTSDNAVRLFGLDG